MCHKFCSNYEDAEEAVQDTFLIALKKSTDLKFETFTAYLAYLRKVAIHESFRKRKANSRMAEYFVPTDKLPEDYKELNENFLPIEALSNKERSIELMNMINSLSKMQAEMICMYYFANFSVAEIADLMDSNAASVYNILSRGRQALKAKLEGTDKKQVITSASVPLSALFILEEQAFAAAYTPAYASFGTTSTVVAAAKTKVYVIAACVLTAGVVATVLYFASQRAVDYYPAYEPYEPVYEAYIPYETNMIHDDFAEELPAEIEEPEEPAAITEPEPIPAPLEEEPEPEPEPEEVEPEPPLTPPHIEPPPVQEEPVEEYTEEFAEESTIEDEPYEPEPTPEPVHIDRTAEILAALAAANTASDVAEIINQFGFSFIRPIRLSTDELLRFYVLDDGSGDILIGVAAYEDGTGWHMRFAHYNNSQAPSDVVDLLDFMEQ